MSTYLKLCYDTPDSYNQGIKWAIEYIGKRESQWDYSKAKCFKVGVSYISKRFGKFRKTAILRMVYPKLLKNQKKEWHFKKQTYTKVYQFIADYLKKARKEDMDEVISILSKLYSEIKIFTNDTSIERKYSNALIYWQKKILSVNRTNDNLDISENSTRILHEINKKDIEIPYKS